MKKVTDLITSLTSQYVLNALDDAGEIDRRDSYREDAIKRSKLRSTKRRRLEEAVAKAEAAFDRAMDTEEMRDIARRNARRTERHNEREVARQLRQSRSAIGIQRLSTKQAASIRSSFVKRNVALIKTIPEQHFRRLEKEIASAFEKGTSSRVLKKTIREIGGVTKRRAALIARDQIGSLNSQLTKEKQKANGVTHFIWRSVGDERVREEHEALDGQRFPIDEGAPGEGFPGEPINCRCFSEPVFN